MGLASGTLPHHLIEGEEAFAVERDDADTVRFGVAAFLRPRGPVMGAVRPLVEALDHRIVRRYLHGLRQHAWSHRRAVSGCPHDALIR